MQNFELHPKFYSQPISLTEEERLEPMSVIKEFFSEINLTEVRTCMCKLLDVSLTRPNTLFDEANERDIALYTNNSIIKVLEAAWVINKQDRRPNPKKSIY